MRKSKQLVAAGVLNSLLLCAVVVAQQSGSHAQPSEVQISATRKSAIGDKWSTLRDVELVDQTGNTTLKIGITPAVRPGIVQLTDPARIVLDFPATMSTIAYNQKAIHKDGLIGIRVGVHAGDVPSTRVVLDLLRRKEYAVTLQPNEVLLTLVDAKQSGPSIGRTALPQSDPPVTSASRQSDSPAGLSSLHDVKVVERSGKTRIEIGMSRPVKPTLLEIGNPVRLVMDFPSTTSDIPRNQIMVNRGDIARIRLGVHAGDTPITRVVLDLKQPCDYVVDLNPNAVVLTLNKAKQLPSVAPTVDSDAVAALQNIVPPSTPAATDIATPLTPAQPAAAVDNSASINTTSSQSDPPPTPTAGPNDVGGSPGTDSSSSAVPRETHESLSANPDDKMTEVPNQVPSSIQSKTSEADPHPTVPNQNVSPDTDNGSGSAAPMGQALLNRSPSSPSDGDPVSNTAGQKSPAPPLSPGISAQASEMTADQTMAIAPLADLSAPPLTRTTEGTGTKAATPVSDSVTLPGANEYVIGEQDQLNITVWKEPELSGLVVVRPDGKITVPLINEVRVVGLTPAQLQTLLTEKLKPFVNIPQVTVAVRQIGSRNVFLIGEVAREGSFPINSSTTILQLIAEAGGLKDFAKRKAIYVLRKEQGKQVRHKFNYDEVIQGKNSQQNILLQPGDTVVVP